MNKKITLIIPVVLLAVLPLWIFIIAPQLTQLSKNFSYTADIVSVDNFYDERAQTYLGEQRSVTTFSYDVVSDSSEGLTIKNNFDVRTPQGKKIISINRMYGINPRTGAHIGGLGDRNRDGYLFAPRNLKEGQPFTYWHVNYDGPAQMQYVAKEQLYGLSVFHYETDYKDVPIDQTADLGNLPDVPEKRGVILEPHLEVWVEPVTGYMVKYQDHTTAYYYDVKTSKKIAPWNTFSNVYTNESIQAQVAIAGHHKLNAIMVQKVIPGIVFLVVLFFLLSYFFKQKFFSKLKDRKPLVLLTVTIVFLVSTSFTVGVFVLVKSTINDQLATQFQKQSNEISALIEKRMSLYADLTNGEKGLFAASTSVEKDEWNKFIEALDLEHNYPGVSAMGYIKRVPKSSVSTYPNKIYPFGDKADYYPVTYLEPQTRDRAALIGFDVSSEQKRADTLKRAMDTGQTTASPVVTTVTSNPEPSFAVYSPLYYKNISVDTVSKRRQALVGFVNVSFRVKSLFEDFKNNPIFHKDIDVEVYDASTLAGINDQSLIFDSGADLGSGHVDNSLFSHSSTIVVSGRTWTLLFRGLHSYQSGSLESTVPAGILTLGLIFSFLLGWLIYSLSNARERAVMLAQNMTKDLSESKEDLQNFLDGLSTFTAKVDLSGKVLFANKAAMEASGQGEKFIGADIISGDWFTYNSDTAQRVKEAFQKALTGTSIKYDENIQLTTPNGKVVRAIDFSIIPITSGGKISYLIVEGRDISADKKIAEEIRQKSSDLERMNKLMMNRESKMADLKKELESLRNK